MIILLVPTSLSLLVYMCAQACTCVFDPSCTRISISCQVKVSPQAPLMCRAALRLPSRVVLSQTCTSQTWRLQKSCISVLLRWRPSSSSVCCLNNCGRSVGDTMYTWT
jgi:hypothetical protein